MAAPHRHPCHYAGASAPAAIPCVSGTYASLPASALTSPGGKGAGGEGEREVATPRNDRAGDGRDSARSNPLLQRETCLIAPCLPARRAMAARGQG